MAKQKTQFLCNTCGSVHPKWLGKCPDCGTWDALEEYKPLAADDRNPLINLEADSGTGDIARGGGVGAERRRRCHDLSPSLKQAL